MGHAGKEARILDGLWLMAWGVFSSLWCLSAGHELGATFDEPTYLARGLEAWRTGSHQGLLRLGTMPLPIDIQTLPLYIVEKWTGTALDPVGECGRLLPWARAGNLLFWWLLLFYALRAGRHIAGRWGGRAAVALLACEPSLLAHASLATTDIAVTAAVLALTVHFATGREAGWGWRVGVPALWYAVAVLAKASGLVFGPLCLLAVELERVGREKQARGEGLRPLWPAVVRFRRDLLPVMALGLLLVFLYCGSDWEPEASFVRWARGLDEGPARTSMVWLADNLRIFSNAGEGIVRQVRHNVRGHGVFLLGEIHPRALWYYFPVALSIKLTVPVLVLALALAVLRPQALASWAGLAAAVLLLFSLNCRVQIGIRLVLPLVVMALIGLSAGAVNVLGRTPPRPGGGRAAIRWLPAAALAAAVVWGGASAVQVWPDGLCYTNELWGGTERGYLRLSDSNYDWGQGLGELADWQKKEGLEHLDVWYFGSDPAMRELPMRNVPLHVLPIDRPEDVARHVRGRYLAAGTTLVYGMPCNTEQHRRASAFLRRARPVARTRTFLIYDLGPGAESTAEKTNTAPGRGPGRRVADVRGPEP
jgi:hypothetical protein